MNQRLEETRRNGHGLEIRHPELCSIFTSRQDRLPRVVDPLSLSNYLTFLLQYPYLEVINELHECALDKSRVMPTQRLSRLEGILQSAATNELLQACMKQEIQPGYQFNLVPRGGDYEELLARMSAIPNCIDPDEREEAAQRIQTDINLGACVKIFGVNGDERPQMYLRYYVTVGRSKEVLLQIDAVEGGTKSYWTKVKQWADAGRGKELLYGISTALYVADVLGIGKLVLGDFESEELGKMLGCRRIHVYGTDVQDRKIGLPPRIAVMETNPAETSEGHPITQREVVISPGVFANRLTEDSYQRVLSLDYRSLPTESIHEQTERMIADGRQYHPRKLRELGLLHQATTAIRKCSEKPLSSFLHFS